MFPILTAIKGSFTAIKEYGRKKYFGRTLDEVVEELRNRGATAVSLSGDARSATENQFSDYTFFVDYYAKTKTGEIFELRERADRTYSCNWRKDTNQRLIQRKVILERELERVKVDVRYRREDVPPYS